MSALAKPHMTVDEYLAWSERQPGKYELFRGEIFAMAPETAGHATIKFAVQSAIAAGLRKRKLPCRMLPDGMTVRIDSDTAYEPDALVYCGKELPPKSLEVPEPVIVVEVLSPSTRRMDVSLKLAGYFRLPSVMHYLIVDPAQPTIIHHARGDAGMILTRVAIEGTITLDPPGLELALADIYAS
jgi:Uma2 family endonuclease